MSILIFTGIMPANVSGSRSININITDHDFICCLSDYHVVRVQATYTVSGYDQSDDTSNAYTSTMGIEGPGGFSKSGSYWRLSGTEIDGTLTDDEDWSGFEQSGTYTVTVTFYETNEPSNKDTDTFSFYLDVSNFEHDPDLKTTLRYPEDGEIISTRNPTFQWSSVQEAYEYQIMVSYSNGILDQTKSTSYTFEYDFSWGETYTWSVCCRKENVYWEDYTNSYSFTIGDTDTGSDGDSTDGSGSSSSGGSGSSSEDITSYRFEITSCQLQVDPESGGYEPEAGDEVTITGGFWFHYNIGRVTGRLSSSDGYVSIIDGADTYDEDGDSTGDGYRFKISEDCPDGHEARLKIRLSDEDGHSVEQPILLDVVNYQQYRDQYYNIGGFSYSKNVCHIFLAIGGVILLIVVIIKKKKSKRKDTQKFQKTPKGFSQQQPNQPEYDQFGQYQQPNQPEYDQFGQYQQPNQLGYDQFGQSQQPNQSGYDQFGQSQQPN